MTLRSHLLAALSLTLITLNLLLWVIPLVLLAGLKFVGLGGVLRADALMDAMYRVAVRIDDAWLQGVLGIEWSRPEIELARDRTVVLLANHRSWADIFPIQSVIVGQGPLVKFLAKRQLLYLPIVGAILWAFDFPLLRRSGGEGLAGEERRRLDQEALRTACEVLDQRPAALMNFAEGTRFTPEKRLAVESPYRHLLPPRTGGLHTILDALRDSARTVVDLTLVYPEGPVSFWRFLAGRVPRVEVDVASFPIETIPRDREGLAAWLRARWHEKDARIEHARTSPLGDPRPPPVR